MEDLRMLVSLVQGSKFRSDGLLNILLEPDTQMRRLYDALASNQVQRDEDAYDQIPEMKGSKSVLATVKSKLKDRLNDALLFLEFNDTAPNDRQKAYVESTKTWAAATVLLSKNYREYSIQKLEKLLRTTKRFEFTEMTIDILQLLRLQSCVIFGNELEYREYNKQLRHYQSIRLIEDHVEACYTELMISFVNSRSDKREMAETAQEFYTGIQPFFDRCDTYRFHLFGRLIQLAIYDNQNDYQEVIRLCEDAITFFDKKPYKSFSVLQVFHYTLLMSYLNLQQYDRCRVVAKQYESLFQRGSYNWFKWLELYFLTEMHDGCYSEAASIWQLATEQPEFFTLPANITEPWVIFEAYLYFVQRFHAPQNSPKQKKFRMGRLLNNIQVANRDKSGMNIPILVIQFLLPLVEGNREQCFDREEALAKYRTRYLRIGDAARSHYFFKILEQIAKSNFEAEDLEQKAQPLLASLAEVPLNAANQNFEVEIVPYETLWEMIRSIFSSGGETASKNTLQTVRN